MLVRYFNGCCPEGPPLGAVGEVTTDGVLTKGIFWVNVNFPKHPSPAAGKGWYCHPTEIIPINDPDADISDTEEAPIFSFDLVGIK